MNRRDFIRNAALAGVLLRARESVAAQADGSAPSAAPGVGAELIDTNVYVSRWPFRRLWADETPHLVAKLKEHGVTSAWAGNFDSIFHRDIGAVNIRLAEECARHGEGLLVPFGAVNPTLPDWEEDLRRCHEVHRMPGIRLIPNYHGYKLDDPKFARLLDLATRRGLIVQIPHTLEDARTQNPIVQVPPVWPEPLFALLKTQPKARVMLLNYTWGNPVVLRRLAAVPQLSLDLCQLEVVAAIEQQMKAIPNLRLLFGSYSPFFNFESAEMKLQESILTPGQLTAIRSGNAQKLLTGA